MAYLIENVSDAPQKCSAGGVLFVFGTKTHHAKVDRRPQVVEVEVEVATGKVDSDGVPEIKKALVPRKTGLYEKVLVEGEKAKPGEKPHIQEVATKAQMLTITRTLKSKVKVLDGGLTLLDTKIKMKEEKLAELQKLEAEMEAMIAAKKVDVGKAASAAKASSK